MLNAPLNRIARVCNCDPRAIPPSNLFARASIVPGHEMLGKAFRHYYNFQAQALFTKGTYALAHSWAIQINVCHPTASPASFSNYYNPSLAHSPTRYSQFTRPFTPIDSPILLLYSPSTPSTPSTPRSTRKFLLFAHLPFATPRPARAN
jgi:hypothetical protein